MTTPHVKEASLCNVKDAHQCPLHPPTLQKPCAAEAEQVRVPRQRESSAHSSIPQQWETKINRETGWNMPKAWKHWAVLLSLGTAKGCATQRWNTPRGTAGEVVILDVLSFLAEAVILWIFIFMCFWSQAVQCSLSGKGGVGKVGLQAGVQPAGASGESAAGHHVRVCRPNLGGRKGRQMERVCLPTDSRGRYVLKRSLGWCKF